MLLTRDMLLVGGTGKAWQQELAMRNTAPGPLQGSCTLSAHDTPFSCAPCMPLRAGDTSAGTLPLCILHDSQYHLQPDNAAASLMPAVPAPYLPRLGSKQFDSLCLWQAYE